MGAELLKIKEFNYFRSNDCKIFDNYLWLKNAVR